MLQTNQRFQNDIKRYNESIDRMPEGQSKIESKRLLNDLVYEVKNLDNMFLDMAYAKQLSSTGNEMREKIIILRKKLEEKLKNYR